MNFSMNLVQTQVLEVEAKKFKIHMNPKMWGLISSIVPELNLKAGDELLADYGYGNKDGIQQEFPDDFPWYWELKRKLEKEENVKKKIKKKSKKGKSK